MCLITKQDVPTIAEKDITVYKILKKGDKDIAKSIYRYFDYKLNTTYSTEIEDIQEPMSFDGESTSYLQTLYAGWGDWYSHNGKILTKYNLKSYGPGFHSCATKERCYPVAKDRDYSIYECIIPKGSEYYMDGNDLLVSNQIIIKELCV